MADHNVLDDSDRPTWRVLNDPTVTWTAPHAIKRGSGFLLDLGPDGTPKEMEHRFDRSYDESDPGTVIHPNGTSMTTSDRDLCRALTAAAWGVSSVERAA